MSRSVILVLGLLVLFGATQPMVAQAETTGPETTGPEATESEGAEPEATEPEGADPFTDPGPPELEEPEPTTTEPATTEPATTEPGTSAPPAAQAEVVAAQLTATETIALIRSVFPGADANRAVAIARCESGLRTNVRGGPNNNGTYDWGLFQFNDGGTLQSTLNKLGYPGTLQYQQQLALNGPLNTRMALSLRNDRGWGPWWCAWKLGIVNGKWSSAPGPNWDGYDENGLPRPLLREDMSRYVAQTYRDTLRREPDAAGLAGWNDALRRGLARDQFADAMVYSFESSMNHAGDLYYEILGRAPDLNGQRGWAGEIAAKRLTLKDARAVYWSSDERFMKSGFSNRQWVTDLYRMELKRNPEQAALDGWVAELDGGWLNRTQVAQAFVDCTECATKAVTLAYREYLGRDPEPAGLAGWVSIYPRSDYLVLTTYFIASQEYYIKSNS